ncbi:MAG: hypothetical protein IPK26_00050 [Planctomycetes bacterium]|nr:hypothetical protein [Planctomycetota bacterium]
MRLRVVVVVVLVAVALLWAAFSGEVDQAPDAKASLDNEPTSREAVRQREPDVDARPTPIVADRVVAKPMDADPRPRAISTAMPVLSLAGALESHFNSIAGRKKWRGDPREVVLAQGATQVATHPHYNPRGKKLSADQTRQLQAVIDGFDERQKPIHAAERKATIEALARAAAAGQFESIEARASALDPVGHNLQFERGLEEMKMLQERLTSRLGKCGVDWSFATAPSTEPDGVPRQSLVYILRANEPEVFRLRDEEAAIMREFQKAYREFFDRIP